MNKLHEVVEHVIAKERQKLKPSTFDVRKQYLTQLAEHGDLIGETAPSQKLYDSFVARADTPDLRFQLFHAVRFVDAEAKTLAFTPEGRLYNEPSLPSAEETDAFFRNISFPIPEGSIDLGYLIRWAEKEMMYLQLTPSTNGQYMKAWRELYCRLYTRGNTAYTKKTLKDFVDDAVQQNQCGTLHMWKLKIRRRAVNVLLETAETGHFEWKLFLSKGIHCGDESVENLREQYRSFIESKNLEGSTIVLYDYSFRLLIEEAGIQSIGDLEKMGPGQIQSMIKKLSERLSLNSRRTIFPVIRQVLKYLYAGGFIREDYSGIILSPNHQRMHLRPYITSSDEQQLISVINDSPLRTRAMMRMALRLGLRDIDICNLRFSQIDWQNDRIVLEQEKTNVVLYLPLLEDVGNALMDYILNERPKVSKDYPYVFLRTQAPYRKVSTLYNTCSKLMEKAGVSTVNGTSHGVHVCRYTLTHKLLKAKVPHQVITDTLGHVSKESDKPYLSMEEEMLRECPLDFSLIGQKYWEGGGSHV